jgi:hypothetical protein
VQCARVLSARCDWFVCLQLRRAAGGSGGADRALGGIADGGADEAGGEEDDKVQGSGLGGEGELAVGVEDGSDTSSGEGEPSSYEPSNKINHSRKLVFDA